MKHTNLELSKNELLLITNSEIILTKNRVIEKVYNLFGSLANKYSEALLLYKDVLPNELYNNPPKIYKGEQYQSLPYVMMDYPRLFLKQDVFAIRSLFWWGNYFSITLQLSGKYLNQFADKIIATINTNELENFFIGVNETEWEHHFEANNYLPLNEWMKNNDAENIKQFSFLKLAAKIPLERWNEAAVFFVEKYKALLMLLQSAS